MNTGKKFIFSLVFSLITLGCIVGFSVSNGNFAPVDADPIVTNAQGGKAEPEKKAADLPKTTQAVSATKAPMPKQISMADAVIIAERTAKGYTTKAERTDRPTVSFTFEVMTREGTKTRVILTGDGTVKSSQANPSDLAPTITGKKGKGERNR